MTATETIRNARQVYSMACDVLKALLEKHVERWDLLEATQAVGRSLEGFAQWGHRPVTDANVERVLALVRTLQARADVLESLLQKFCEPPATAAEAAKEQT